MLPKETWSINKPAVKSDRGIVTAQHYIAAQAGASILEMGGNAIDAAIASAFSLGVVEPWMSGLGGCGYMLVYIAETRKTFAIDFGVNAPIRLDPAKFPLSGGYDSDLFAWPEVLENRNILGPTSVAVPGFVAGMAEAAKRFSSLPWIKLLAPAIHQAESGLCVDWYSSLKIASAASVLNQFPSSQSIYLPGGFVPMGAWAGPPPTIKLTGLTETLQQLANEGPSTFYSGRLAADLVDDFLSVGINIRADDLLRYRAQCTELSGFKYRDSKIFASPGLCAGPNLLRALELLESFSINSSSLLDAKVYIHYANSLKRAYAERLQDLGDTPESKMHTSTTHLNVIDQQGNVVAITQTLLSLFGSKLVLPKTGILMNNGIMWFDPRTNHPNSLGPKKQPLSNMCPAIVLENDGSKFAIGASGGRRITSAVLQLISFMIDFAMEPEIAMHQPRIDISSGQDICVDSRLEQHIIDQLGQQDNVVPAEHGVFPNLFACPGIARWDATTQQCTGASFIYSPLADSVAER